jgi:hypothetical protein
MVKSANLVAFSKDGQKGTHIIFNNCASISVLFVGQIAINGVLFIFFQFDGFSSIIFQQGFDEIFVRI